MRCAASELSSGSRLNCGWRREPGARARRSATRYGRSRAWRQALPRGACRDRRSRFSACPFDPCSRPDIESFRGASPIHRDLDESLAVLVPEGPPLLNVGKNAGAADGFAVDHESAAARRPSRAQPRYGVAVMIDVDDLGEIIGAE